MSSDEELERLKLRRLMELQAQQREEELRREAEAQKQLLLWRILTPKARQRLTNIKMVRPDYAEQLELQLIQAARTGRIRLPITDDMLRRLLAQIQAQQRREIKIRRI